MQSFRQITKQISCLIFITFVFLSAISGKDHFIVSLNGTYDFDRDGLSEFLSIEKTSPDDKQANLLSYSEIDETGAHIELWQYNVLKQANGLLADARIADTNGDGIPEVVVAVNAITPADQHAILLFEWDNETFTQTPVARWTSSARLSNLAILDAQGDNSDEIAVSLGIPSRQITVLSINYSADRPEFTAYASLTSPEIGNGYGQIFVSTLDHNQDGITDLMAISPEINRLKVQIFENHDGEFVQGPYYEQPLEAGAEPGTFSISSVALNSVDIDQDGLDEILLPFQSGTLMALETGPDTLLSKPIDVDVYPLFNYPKEGMSENTISEILLARAEIGITGMKARYLKLETLEKGVSVEEPLEAEEPAPLMKVREMELTPLTEKPEEEAPEIIEGEELEAQPPPAKKVQQLQLKAIEREAVEEVVPEPTDTLPVPSEPEEGLPEETAEAMAEELAAVEISTPEVGEEPSVEEPEAEVTTPTRALKKVEKLQLTSVPKKPEIITPDVLPPGAEIADTVYWGDTLSLPLETDEKRSFHSFKWLTKEPTGATLDLVSRSIQWIPSQAQLGIRKFAYLVEYKVGEKIIDLEPSEEGGAVGQEIVPVIESDSVEIYILVEEPGEIEEPEITDQ